MYYIYSTLDAYSEYVSLCGIYYELCIHTVLCENAQGYSQKEERKITRLKLMGLPCTAAFGRYTVYSVFENGNCVTNFSNLLNDKDLVNSI